MSAKSCRKRRARRATYAYLRGRSGQSRAGAGRGRARVDGTDGLDGWLSGVFYRVRGAGAGGIDATVAPKKQAR